MADLALAPDDLGAADVVRDRDRGEGGLAGIVTADDALAASPVLELGALPAVGHARADRAGCAGDG